MADKRDPDGKRLPIKVDTATNGEYEPRPLTKAETNANAAAHRRVGEAARHTGRSRRSFLISGCGAAATLLAFNETHRRLGATGGFFDIPAAAAYESNAASAALDGEEFIFDIQNHCVEPSGDWISGEDGERWIRALTQLFPQSAKCAESGLDCYSAQQLLKDVFLDSDTTVGVVSALWGRRGASPTPISYAAEARAVIDAFGHGKRALIHGGARPNEPGWRDHTEILAKEYKVAAWKLYPQWGPDGTGYFVDDEEYGQPFIEHARNLGVRVICAHRGLPLPFLPYEYSDPSDMPRAARQNPDMIFIVYHSGFEPGRTEGPYDPANKHGIDRLIRSHQENGFRRNEGNVYAELGSLWRYVMSKPDQAAHVIGKLVKYLGEDRICWGTDTIWYGSPQDQIQAFRSFQISPEFQEKYGYPALTAAMKERIFGLNAAEAYGLDVEAIKKASREDSVGRKRAAYRENPDPAFRTHGPKSRRAFLAHWRAHNWIPG